MGVGFLLGPDAKNQTVMVFSTTHGPKTSQNHHQQPSSLPLIVAAQQSVAAARRSVADVHQKVAAVRLKGQRVRCHGLVLSCPSLRTDPAPGNNQLQYH